MDQTAVTLNPRLLSPAAGLVVAPGSEGHRGWQQDACAEDSLSALPSQAVLGDLFGGLCSEICLKEFQVKPQGPKSISLSLVHADPGQKGVCPLLVPETLAITNMG